MQKVLGFVVVALALLAAPLTAFAQQRPEVTPELLVGERVAEPMAWAQFCREYPADCVVTPGKTKLVVLSSQTMRQLDAVNSTVNRQIKPVTDPDHWGWNDKRFVYVNSMAVKDVDRWNYAEDGSGDCEDYVLAKQKKLIELGWPRSALLITTVRTSKIVKGVKVIEGHAVLTVRTTDGDFILTNDTNLIKAWWETDYQFIMRQSEENPNMWLSLQKPVLASAK